MGPSDMQFAAIYRRYLEQALMKHGYSVVETSADAVVLNTEVQTFVYGNNSDDKQLFDYNTFWTSLADVGYGISTINTVDGALWTVGVAGPAFDVLDAMNRTTNAEVTVTTSVSDASRLYYTDTESFYVKPTDLPFYWTAQRPGSPQVMPGAPLQQSRFQCVGSTADAHHESRCCLRTRPRGVGDPDCHSCRRDRDRPLRMGAHDACDRDAFSRDTRHFHAVEGHVGPCRPDCIRGANHG